MHALDRRLVYPAPYLTYLVYRDGTTILLAQLLGHLPHLTTLHVGFLSRDPSSEPHALIHGADALRPTCRLRDVAFHSVYHYDVSHADWLLDSSMMSIETVAFINYGALLNDLLPWVNGAKHLTLTIKENSFGVAEYDTQYLLENIVSRFTRLEKVRRHSICIYDGTTSCRRTFSG